MCIPPGGIRLPNCFLDRCLCTQHQDPPGVSKTDCSCIFPSSPEKGLRRKWDEKRDCCTPPPLSIAAAAVFQPAKLRAVHGLVVVLWFSEEEPNYPLETCVSPPTLQSQIWHLAHCPRCDVMIQPR